MDEMWCPGFFLLSYQIIFRNNKIIMECSIHRNHRVLCVVSFVLEVTVLLLDFGHCPES